VRHKLCAHNLTIYADLWNENAGERTNARGHKRQEYFVNGIEVAQNIDSSVTLNFYLFLLISLPS
jgi:hypothetical protein